MEFLKYKTSNYYQSSETSAFIFADNSFTKKEFDIKNGYSSYNFRFLLVFTYGNLDFDDQNVAIKLNQVLSGINNGPNSKILWIDDFSKEDYSVFNFISVINHQTVFTLNVGKGKIENNAVNFVKDDFEPLRISFEDNHSQLLFQYTTEAKLQFFANGGSAFFNTFSILIKTDQATKEEGALVFENGQLDKNNPISLITPYVLKENLDSDEEPLVNIKYLDDSTLQESFLFSGTYYPFLVEGSTQMEGIQSLFSFEKKHLVNSFVYTNFLNSKGERLQCTELPKLGFRINTISIDGRDDRVSIIPKDQTQIILKSPTANDNMLLGFSGTESLGITDNEIVLEFRESSNFIIDKDKKVIEDSIGSITSLPTFKEAGRFNLDAEKAPLFNNRNINPSIALSFNEDIQSREVSYSPIGISDSIPPGAIPVIPTLFFLNNPSLIEVENVFSKARLIKFNEVANLSASEKERMPYVTPQGFLKSQLSDLDTLVDQFRFIKPEDNPKKDVILDLNKGDQSKFRFDVKVNREDFDYNLSISKEDVFFVVTPRLIKEVLAQPEFDIFFSLRGFDVNLLFNFIQKPSHTEHIIVFKFSKRNVDEMLQDPSRWSNYGKYKREDWSDVLEPLREQFKRFSEHYDKSPGIDNDYFYIDQVIRRDSNWNGVFILNIPIADGNLLPNIFNGLSGSQDLEGYPNPKRIGAEGKLQFKTGLSFKYIAFPVNRTFINKGAIEIKSTSFYGLIDYDLLLDKGSADSDYQRVSDFFPSDNDKVDDYKFLLTKLLIRFENTEIRNFKAFSFIQIPNLFDNKVTLENIPLTHNGQGDPKANLIRLDGNYQKNSAGQDEFNFNVNSDLQINFDGSNVLKNIKVTKLSFGYFEGTDEYRFDIDAKADINSWSLSDIISIKDLDFQNIGLKFDLKGPGIPRLHFDLSKLLVLPKINYDGNGFLSSFPIKFSYFENFKLKLKGSAGNFDLDFPDNDFFNLQFKKPNIALNLPNINVPNLFSFIFDFDLGTLGNLAALKALKGQLLVGWSLQGGFALGFKLNGPSSDGLHLDLFGALKLDIEKVELCKLNHQYILRLSDARLTILGVQLPPSENMFSALIFAKPGEKIAWLISYVEGNDPDVIKNKLSLGIGQRVGIGNLANIKEVDDAITEVKRIFDPKRDICNNQTFPTEIYKPDNNWLVASENVIPESWKNIIDFKFIFNDPVLYGVFIKLVGLFDVDIIYKKVSDNLGVWSLEFALDPSIRTIEMGAACITLPNIGIDIYTNGNWKGDVGFPRGADFSRSCLVQIRPFVGWGGMYLMQAKTASLTLFKGFITDNYSKENLMLLQAGFALRVGLGAYIDKGIFYVGASISVYGILEGAFAFERKDNGLAKVFPNHFALLGRVGAIAEVIGYVDFKVIKASIHLILRVEVGMLLVYIGKDQIPGSNSGKGLQPVNLYIEGHVSVSIKFTICCFRIFRKKICITIHLKFATTIRFGYTLGGSSGGANIASLSAAVLVELPTVILIDIRKVPVVYLPSFTKSNEDGVNQFHLIHNFAIPFLGVKMMDEELKISENNIFKDDIIIPLFSSLLNGLPAEHHNYQDLRGILLAGKLNEKEIKLQFASFRPTFILGKDLNNPADDVLQSVFRFKKANHTGEDEISLYHAANVPCDTNPEKCPFRLIPVPISSKIIVENYETGELESWESNEEKGFRIQINNIIGNGSSNTIAIDIKAERKYSEVEINEIEEHFNDYKTQFLERQQATMAALEEGGLDLREDVIIPEYFKLVGLLVLEAYYYFEGSKEENKIKNSFNPAISVATITNAIPGEKTWCLNEHVDNFFGQLNYYYNNGLRMPDVKGITKPRPTKPCFMLTGQVSRFTNILDKSYASVDIKIINLADSGEAVSLKEDMLESKDDLDRFRSSIAEKTVLDLSQLEQFDVPTITEPFELVPVRFTIQNSALNTIEDEFRFFELPGKIARHNSPNYALNLNLQAKQDNATERLVRNQFQVCANVEVKVKPHQVNGKVQILELINVNIDDLELMNKIRADYGFINSITLYLKEENNQSLQLKKIINAKVRVIKTNLSPKTHPPVIDVGSEIQRLADTEEKYWADSMGDDLPEFVRLVWEGLTTNNGGYFLQLDDESLFPVKEKLDLQYELVLSFESTQEKFNKFCNYIKLPKTILPGKPLFELLDQYTHYLFIDLFSTNKDQDGNYITIKEYHSKVPAHCLGFTIERSKPAEEFSQYLPLEFELAEINDSISTVVLSREKVLPLMRQCL